MFALVKRSKKYIIVLVACFVLLYSLSFASKTVNLGITGVKIIKPKSRVIIRASWGKAKGKFGKTNEGPILGPMSFSVVKNNVYFLDQENKRVQSFSLHGDYLASFPLKKQTYVDIKAVGFNIYLLDAYVNYCVDVYTPQGDLIKSLPINKSLDPVTGFQVVNGKVLVESNHTTSTVIGDVRGSLVNKTAARQVFRGRFANNGRPIKVRFDKSAFIFQNNKLTKFQSPDLKAIIDLLVDGKSTYVLLGFGKETKDSMTGCYLSLLKITNGKPECQIILPYKYATDHFRKIDVYNNAVYQMQTTTNGLVLVRW